MTPITIVEKKRCPYCQTLHPADDFVLLKRGRGGRVTVAQCGECYRARQRPEENKERLARMVESSKAANKRVYFAFVKEKSR
jgi:hypothetical protein